MVLPENILYCLNALERSGYEAWVVGGCVRDAVLGRTPKDYDICTRALPEQTRAVFAGHQLILAGEKHGTVGVVAEDQAVEITTYRADERDPWEYTWIEFDGLRAQECLRLAGISGPEPIYTPASQDAGEKLCQEMLYIANNGNADPMHLIGHGFLFLSQLVESSSYQRNQSVHRLRDFYIREALSFIESNFQRDITIEEIAAFCGLNRSYFGKVFRETMGESPQAFLLHYRMGRAAQLLKETRLSIGEIAQQVSYDNQLHFSRAFKNVHGVSPREYRQTHFVAFAPTDNG